MSSKPPIVTPGKTVAILIVLFTLALVPVCAVILGDTLNRRSLSTEIEAVESRIDELESQVDILNDHVDELKTQKREVATARE